jgi:energy-coupling factor transport system ATP-binding protein
MTAAIELRGVSFAYPDRTRALENIDLSIATGECIAIVGQNGSGKSTLVRHLNGLLRPGTGDVLIEGKPVGRRHVAELARTVGLVFQNPDRQIFAGSVRGEVSFGPRNLGRRGEELDRDVAAAVAAVGLDTQLDANPYDLGFSRRKLLSLASILAMRTPIVVLDEPTTGQDARGVARVQAIVRDLAASGQTVIAISHDMRFVAESFQRVVVMRAGSIVLDGPPADVFGAGNVETLASTWLEPPLPAVVGARLGLGSTPTESALVEAIQAKPALAGA